MPHNLCAALVAARGYSVVARTDPSSTARNVISLRMFMDALPLQPCNPTFKSLYVFLLKRDTEPEFFFWQPLQLVTLGSRLILATTVSLQKTQPNNLLIPKLFFLKIGGANKCIL